VSSTSYEKAKELILDNDELADFNNGVSNELIALAEEKIGLKFTGSYLDFLQTFGVGNFGAEEIYGIIHEDFENSATPDAIWFTLTEREESNLPSHLLVIYHTGGVELFCLDYSKLDDDKEPRVVVFVPGFELKYQTYEVIADTFGDFLLELVEEQLEEDDDEDFD
jgi:antitoxin YobK